jgi:hypothetical protein
MHALVTTILLGMAWLDSFNADTEPEPPDREFAQVEQGVSGSERTTVVATDVAGQAALLKKPFKHGESVVLLGGGQGFTGNQKTAGVIGKGKNQRVAMAAVARELLGFISALGIKAETAQQEPLQRAA